MSFTSSRSWYSKISRRVGVIAGAASLALAGSIPLAGSSSAETLRIATDNLPPSRGDPHTSLSFQTLYVWQTLFDALTVVDVAGKAQPSLALSWENKAPDTWHFRLRPNVKFHNGRTFNADAIVHSVSYLISDEGKANSGIVFGSLRHLAGATRIDDLTVEIKTRGPSPILPNELSALKIVEPGAWVDLGRDGFIKDPSGTGAFRVTAWDEGQLDTVRFADGWRPNKLDAITWLALPESAARVSAFASEQVHLALSLGSDSKELIERAGGRLNVGPTPSNSVLMFNMAKPGIAQDLRVRQAFNYALDKTFVDTLLGGVTVPASQPAPRSVNGYQSDIEPYPYDPEKARQLLAEAGFSGGLNVVAEILSTLPDLANVQQHLASNLRQVGVNLELRVITLPDLIGRVTGAKQIEGDMFVFNFGAQPSGDMMRSINNFHSCNFPRKWTCFPDIEATIKMVNGEFDPAKRDAGLREIAQYYHENVPAVWFYEQISLDAISPRVKNYRNDNWVISFPDIELTE